MKKLLSLALSLFIIIALFPLGAITAGAETEDGLTYTISGGEATVTDCDYSKSGELVIPDTLGGCPVTRIGDKAFMYCRELTRVTIPESVTNIGKNAFDSCRYLSNVTINSKVVQIDDEAFIADTDLQNITFNGDITRIGVSAFESCEVLTNVIINGSISSIDKLAFYKCVWLKEVRITDIGNWCSIDFNGCYANPLYYAQRFYLNGKLVTDISLPDNITSIKRYAFYNCRNLSSIIIPDSVTSIGT